MPRAASRRSAQPSSLAIQEVAAVPCAMVAGRVQVGASCPTCLQLPSPLTRSSSFVRRAPYGNVPSACRTRPEPAKQPGRCTCWTAAARRRRSSREHDISRGKVSGLRGRTRRLDSSAALPTEAAAAAAPARWQPKATASASWCDRPAAARQPRRLVAGRLAAAGRRTGLRCVAAGHQHGPGPAAARSGHAATGWRDPAAGGRRDTHAAAAQPRAVCRLYRRLKAEQLWGRQVRPLLCDHGAAHAGLAVSTCLPTLDPTLTPVPSPPPCPQQRHRHAARQRRAASELELAEHVAAPRPPHGQAQERGSAAATRAPRVQPPPLGQPRVRAAGLCQRVLR